MNWHHLRTFTWLRWRLMANQWRRAGSVNAAISIVVVVGLIVSAVPAAVGSFFLAAYLLPKASPIQMMFLWDGLIAGFLFFWSIGVLVELQRSDPLSLDKFLHLPVSIGGAFVINYLGSLVRLSILLLVPILAGVALAQVVVGGWSQAGTPLVLAAFLLMITALTYQLQGYLAALMSNPRRRRTVIFAVTGLFIAASQLPNLINIFAPWSKVGDHHRQEAQAVQADFADLRRRADAGEITPADHVRLQEEARTRRRAEATAADDRIYQQWGRWAEVANRVVPFGWLPVGVKASAEGNPVPALLGWAGLTLIGVGSLALSYRSTIAQYRGRATEPGRARPAPARAAAPRDPAAPLKPSLIERHLPGLSEPVAAVTLGTFRSFLRAPEVKMVLLMPLIMIPVLAGVVLRGHTTVPDAARPLLGCGAIVFSLFGMLQLVGNQFGFDRDGFRVFVLSSADRRDILLGKNLAVVPFVLVLSGLVLAAVQVIYPLRWDHLLAMVPQVVSMFLMFCLIANTFSILTPIRIPAGTMKPANPKMTTVLLQLLMLMVLFPIAEGVTLLPLGAEALARALGWVDRFPVYLPLALGMAGLVVLLYGLTLGPFGRLLQAREQAILETVTGRGT